ncbi:MAG TPA: hypothetical protein VIU40_05890, partial [Geobacteraceae bacterium]
MSLILDALKKLEQEKAARRQGMGLGTAVVYGRSPRRRRRGAVIAGTGAALVLALGMLFAVGKGLQPDAPPIAVTPSPADITPQPVTASPSAPPTLPTDLPASL